MLVLVEAFLIAAPIQSYAQVAVASNNAATAAINKIINGLGTYAAGSVGAATTETIATAAGKTAQVAVAANATGITAARLGALAGGALKLGTVVGLATILIPWVLNQSGIYVCPPPDFFCKDKKGYAEDVTGWTCPGPNGGANVTGSGTITSCKDYCLANQRATTATPSWFIKDTVFAANGLSMVIQLSRPDGATGQCSGSRQATQVATITPAPVSETELSQSVADYANKDSTRPKILYDALVKEKIPVVVGTDTVVITAPPVTLDPVVKTEKIANPSGGTSTKTTTTSTVITPTQVGTTVGTATLKLPETTTQTVVIKDDATNATTTNTTTETAVAAPKDQLQIPDDYNREVTQKAILKTLDGTGVPKGTDIDQTTDLQSIDNQNSTNKDAIGNISPSTFGLNTSGWLPNVPTASCQNPQVPNPLTGAMSSVEICQPISMFGKFLNGVIAFFAIVGSVRQVQEALRA